MKMNQFAYADTPATLNRKQYPYAGSYALHQDIVERALDLALFALGCRHVCCCSRLLLGGSNFYLTLLHLF